MKKELIKTFNNEIYSKPPKKNYPIINVIYNHIDEQWSIDLADMIDCKISNSKGFRIIFIIIDNFSKYLWGIPLKNKNSQMITNEFSNICLNQNDHHSNSSLTAARNGIILFFKIS